MKISTVIIPDEIRLSVNKNINELQYFSLGEIINKPLFSTNTNFNVNIIVNNNPLEFFNDQYENFSTYFKVGNQSIYYEKKYGGFNCKILIKNLKEDNITVYVNNAYLRWIRFKIDNLYPVGIHVTDLLLLKIISKGDLIVHGASLYNPNNDKSFLIVAPPDTGKTYSTYKLLKKKYKFLGEDLSYYSSKEGVLKCMPYTSTWRHHFNDKIFDYSKIPFLGLFFSPEKQIVTDIFGKDSIKDKSRLSKIYILEKSDKNCIEKVDFNDQILKKALVIQRNEFSYFKNPLIRAFEYFNDIDVDKIMQKEKESLINLLSSHNLYIVKGKTYKDFEILIDNNEKQ